MPRPPARLLLAAALAAATLAGCSVGVKRTPGMNLYAQGRHADAIPLLEQEVAAGEVSARYALGLAYRDGVGIATDPRKAEILLTGAAIGGYWGGVGTMNRNLVTGVVELNTASPFILMQMAEIYERPCAGRPVQMEAARALRSLASGPRYIWVYVPG
jgi:TPR repeat protein